jgi:hypothetical protein
VSAAVPARLVQLLEQRGGRPAAQPSVAVRREAYEAGSPGHRPWFEQLPGSLGRQEVQALARRGDLLLTFIASQVWGYGSTGYGPHRLGRALADPALPAALDAAARRLAARDPVQAFRELCVERRIACLGTAFGTKFVHFADPAGRALILDSVVAAWVAEHAGPRWRLQRSATEYEAWLRLAEAWARELETSSQVVELLVFNDGVGARSTWRPQDG